MENQELISKLFKSIKLASNEEFNQFEDSLIELEKTIKIDDIYELCKVFYDNTECEEVMFGLVHLIEKFASEEYLRYIAICSPNMVDGYNWSMTLNKRILNSNNYFHKYVEVLTNIESSYKTKILKLLIDIKNDNNIKFGKRLYYRKGWKFMIRFNILHYNI